MREGVYAVVRRYETPNSDYEDWTFKPSDYYEIYDKMMELTDGDHEISSGAADWCELATEDEMYEFREGEIEMVYIP